MDIDGDLVMQGFLDGMGSFFLVLGYGSVAGMCFGSMLIYALHFRNNGGDE